MFNNQGLLKITGLVQIRTPTILARLTFVSFGSKNKNYFSFSSVLNLLFQSEGLVSQPLGMGIE